MRNKKYLLSLFAAIILIASGYGLAHALPYAPGATLDPSCNPGDANCTVRGVIIDNGTVAGVNATSSTISFSLQGSSGIDPFNISSSSGSSILYVAGTGKIGIGTTTPGGSLVVQPASDSTSAVQFVNNAGASVLNIDTTNGRVGINTTTPNNLLSIYSTGNNLLNLISNGSNAIETLTSYRNSTASHGLIHFEAARGTAASPQVLNVGDTLMSIRGGAWNGTSFSDLAANNTIQLEGYADESFTSTANGGRFAIRITQDGTTNNNFRFVMDGNGNACIGNSCSNATSALPATTTLEVFDNSLSAPTRLFVREANSGLQTNHESFGVYANDGTTPRLVVINGNVGVSTSTPDANLQVANGTNATTTVEFGSAGQNKGTCLKIYDAAGTAWYVTVSTTGTLSASATTCKSGF